MEKGLPLRRDIVLVAETQAAAVAAAVAATAVAATAEAANKCREARYAGFSQTRSNAFLQPDVDSVESWESVIMATQNNQSNSNSGGNTSNRGFASMDQDKQREIAAQGGRASHEQGTGHEFNSQEAREAGSKGGQAAHASGNAHEFSSEEAREAGRKGGQASGGNRSQSKEGGMQASGRGGSQGEGGSNQGRR